MRNLHRALAQSIARALDTSPDSLEGAFVAPPNPKLGDISLPCFQLAKALGQDPRAIAQRVASLPITEKWLAGATVAGPYVNFRLARPEFARMVLAEVFGAAQSYGRSELGRGERIVVDYSSPNVAKHLAVHHLRSTMIGNSIVRLHRALGYEVVGVNHLGDWGTSFGKLLSAWEHFGGSLESPPLEEQEDPIGTLNDLYVRFHEVLAERPDLDADAREWFRRLEAGDAVARARWQRIRDVSWRGFEEIYRRLGVTFEEVIGESFFEDRMAGVIDELAERQLLAESDDARVVFLEQHGMPPLLVTKKDGATLYATRDLAAAEYRWQRWHFAQCLYVVDAGQSLHFKQLFRVLEMAGKEYAGRLRHIEFGVMRLPVDGAWVKGRTRKGQVVLLSRVLDVARDLARAKILDKNPGLETIDAAAERVGVSAVVFADLKARRAKDVNFDLDQITSFEGETGAYLQYTHVRFCGIVRNYAGADPAQADGARLGLDEDVALLRHISSFPEVIEAAAAECEPALMSQYLLHLASLFNTYYAAHRILDKDPEVARDRVALVNALRIVLANGLGLLGIEPLERM